MTISDVAKKAGVSKTTVSRAINNPDLVKAETLIVIKQVMEELKFVPSALAQGLRFNKTYTVGVIIPDTKNPFYTKMLHEINKSLNKYGYMMIICVTSGEFEREKDFIKRLLQRKIDGVLFFTYNNSKENTDFYTLIAKDLPFVLMDESEDGIEISQVVTNGYIGIKNAVKYLINKGHTKIACISSKYVAGRKRYNGYVDALKESGIQLNKEYVLETGYSVKEGEYCARQLLKLKNKPTAIVAVADSMAIGALKAMSDKKINVPNDMEIIGFDNIEWTTIVSPTLSTVKQKMDIIANSAVKILMEKIENPKNLSKIIKKFVNSELILRESTK